VKLKLSFITPTHDPRWLRETWASLRHQTHEDWEWVIVCNDRNGKGWKSERMAMEMRGAFEDARVRVEVDTRPWSGIGDRKRFAFGLGQGDVLVELDHDDLLLRDAGRRIALEFKDPQVGFVYSDWADFEDLSSDGTVQGKPRTYRGAMRSSWLKNGYIFYERTFTADECTRPGLYECVRAFPPSALSMSLIFWAPNHVRAWRRDVYHALGGHNPEYALCDDHELCCRTYGMTQMRHIPEPLYLYRVSQDNTWSKNEKKIDEVTRQVRARFWIPLIVREAELRGLHTFDLGGAFNAPSGWTPVDIDYNAMDKAGGVAADLSSGPWPWPNGSVGAFRAYDFLSQLPDPSLTMREIWRCLAPGGYLLSMTPSTDGRGAFQDPTNRSYWNQNSFWYWTRRDQARYSRNDLVRFQEADLYTYYPTAWHEENKISYVVANLVALKEGYHGPGVKFI